MFFNKINRTVYEKSSEGSSGIQDVHGLLKEQRSNHIQKFVDTEDNLNKAFDFNMETEKYIKERDNLLNAEIPNSKLCDAIK